MNEDSNIELDGDRGAVITAVIAAGQALQSRLDGALGNIKGISYSEYRLLDAIRKSPNGSASRVELAKTVGLTPSGVTRALRPLEKLGMVETARHPRDARQSLAALTGQGQQLLEDADGVLLDAAAADRALNSLSPTEATTLHSLATRLAPGR